MIVPACTFAACGSGEGNWVMTAVSINCRLSPNIATKLPTCYCPDSNGPYNKPCFGCCYYVASFV